MTTSANTTTFLPVPHLGLSRREFLQQSLGAATLLLWGCDSDEPLALDAGGRLLATDIVDPVARGQFLGTLPFIDEGNFATGVRRSKGLDGRIAVDLSTLRSLSTASNEFFVRTFPPQQLPSPNDWTIHVHSRNQRKSDITIGSIRERSRPMGTVLMECAGNGPPVHFGLISSASWTGLPITEVLEPFIGADGSARVLISGFDGTPPSSRSSAPGASWVFTLNQLTEGGAFLAVGMNGGELSTDHGAPVRLIVPGWYGCVCVKWLNEIRFVGDNVPATTQMREFALRTHQTGVPLLARDYLPAIVDRTATPIRVERWRLGRREVLRVVGLSWGKPVASARLGLAFSDREQFVAATACPPLTSDTNWVFWSHQWEPQPGHYRIQMKLLGSDDPTRRLAMPAYMRKVEVPPLV